MAALVANRPEIKLRPGFAKINATSRRFPRRMNQDNVITGAEITVPTEVDINQHTVRAQNIAQYPPEQVMGNNIGHGNANVGIGEDELVFSLKAPSKPVRGKRFDPDRRQVFTGMVGLHFGPIQAQEELEDTLVFRGISAGALTWEGNKLPDPVLSVRIAGAGSTIFTGNDVIEPGEIATWSAYSYDAATRKAELEALPPPQHYSKNKLIPILRTLRQTELVDFIGEAAAESFFEPGHAVSHDFSLLLNTDRVATLDTKRQIMLSTRLFSAMSGFLHCLTAAQFGIVTLPAAGSPALAEPTIQVSPEQIVNLAAQHGLTTRGNVGYLDYSFARLFRGVLPLGLNPQIAAASDISGLVGGIQASSFAGSRNVVNVSKKLVELQNLASHALYNDTTGAYWGKRSRAVCMATTGAGPGDKFEYLLLLS